MTYFDDLPAIKPDFEFPIVARAIAELLLEDYQAARVIAIHGPWGSGKTTLMTAIGTELEAVLGANAAILTFNAWKFDDRGALSRSLILSIVGELREQPLDEQQKKRLDELEESLYHAFSVVEKGPYSINWRSVIVEVASLLLSLVKLDFVAKAVKQSTGFLSRLFIWEGGDKKDKEEKEPIITASRVEKLAGVLERTSLTRSVVEVRSTEQFLAKFRETVAEFTKNKRRLFVLIDDLDRCLPENALQVFESIRLFADAPGCGYIVALDREVIRRGLRIRYGKTAGEAMYINPDEYIEKTVSISLDLPRLSPQDALTIMRRYALELTVQEESLILAGLGTNPRRLKRYMNTLSLQLRIARLAHAATGAIEISGPIRPMFIKLSLLSYRYSPIMNLGAETPVILLELQGTATQSRDKKPKQKQELRSKAAAEVPPQLNLELTPDFWTLLEHEPDLNESAAKLPQVIDWFRAQPVGRDASA